MTHVYKYSLIITWGDAVGMVVLALVLEVASWFNASMMTSWLYAVVVVVLAIVLEVALWFNGVGDNDSMMTSVFTLLAYQN